MAENRTFADLYRYKQKVIKGHLFPSFTDFKAIEEMDKLEIRSDDILISSYPRSGTHWAVELVDIIRRDGDIESGSHIHIHDKFRWLEIPREYLKGGVSLADFEGVGSPITDAAAMPSPRLLVTHMGYDLLPEEAKQGRCKTIVVFRNPKSALVSHMHLLNSFSAAYKSLFNMDIMLNGELTETNDKTAWGTWFNFVKGWCSNKDRLRKYVLFIRYEEMVKDMAKVVRDVATFLDKSLTEEKVQTIVDHLSFGNMKKNPSTGDAFQHMKKSVGSDGDTPHMRKGKIDDWKKYMTVKQSERLDAYFGNTLENMGLHFQYE
ncbi:unnamed protein product [Owenia fusiformis]|uniref:Uncharacterized protein n=1 Tax=Owenia fusiformis TaxID=6347 RepID=A0A8J1U8I9_OWEFU|nr:unnamed protein product [Owenia fusiformis]